MEAEQQKQMISQHQAMNYGRRDSCDLDTVGGRRKGRDSAKTGRPSDDWPQRTEKEKKIQKKPDVSRLQSLGKKVMDVISCAGLILCCRRPQGNRC